MRAFWPSDFCISEESLKSCKILHRKRNGGTPVVDQYRDGDGSSERLHFAGPGLFESALSGQKGG